MPKPQSGNRAGKGGKKNMDKSRQPKRQRYISSGRMVKNAIKNLERHMKKYAPAGQDKAAEESLAKLRGTR